MSVQIAAVAAIELMRLIQAEDDRIGCMLCRDCHAPQFRQVSSLARPLRSDLRHSQQHHRGSRRSRISAPQQEQPRMPGDWSECRKQLATACEFYFRVLVLLPSGGAGIDAIDRRNLVSSTSRTISVVIL